MSDSVPKCEYCPPSHVKPAVYRVSGNVGERRRIVKVCADDFLSTVSLLRPRRPGDRRVIVTMLPSATYEGV